jgi:hypothetical protein
VPYPVYTVVPILVQFYFDCFYKDVLCMFFGLQFIMRFGISVLRILSKPASSFHPMCNKEVTGCPRGGSMVSPTNMTR